MSCDCFSQKTGPDLVFHPEVQDTRCAGWMRLLDLVEQAAADRREDFIPLADMTAEERRQIVTLPVSTRVLYGNWKNRAPFPALLPPGAAPAALGRGLSYPGVRGADAIRTCSVCDRPVEEASLIQVWISLTVATDVLPLLVNACSAACIQKLPPAAEGHVRGAHQGGLRGR